MQDWNQCSVRASGLLNRLLGQLELPRLSDGLSGNVVPHSRHYLVHLPVQIRFRELGFLSMEAVLAADVCLLPTCRAPRTFRCLGVGRKWDANQIKQTRQHRGSPTTLPHTFLGAGTTTCRS
jgi:hypothetical protein